MGELGQKMAFLVITGLLGILCVALRNRPRADGVVLLAAVAAGVSGSLLGVYRPSLTDWLQTLKLLHLLLIIAGCAINLIQWHTDRRMDASRSRER